MIPKSQVFPGVIIRVIKEKRGTLDRVIYFWYEDGRASLPLRVGETFEVLESPKTAHNVTLVKVRWVDNKDRPTGNMRYGELHFHCEIVEDLRPKGRTLWARLDDETV